MSVDSTTANPMLDEYVCTRETVYKDIWYAKGRKLFVSAGTDVNNCNFEAIRLVKKAKKETEAATGSAQTGNLGK